MPFGSRLLSDASAMPGPFPFRGAFPSETGECGRGAASVADMVAMIGAVRPPPWTANGGRRGQAFRVRDENRLEGRLFGPQGRMPPIGLWAVGANEPHARDKTVHGRRRRRMAVNADKFPCSGRKPSRGAFIRSTGVDAAHRAVAVGTDEFPRSGRKPPDPHIRPDAIGFDGQWWRAPPPWRMTPVSLVTRIQSPIKEKTQKNAFLQNH